MINTCTVSSPVRVEGLVGRPGAGSVLGAPDRGGDEHEHVPGDVHVQLVADALVRGALHRALGEAEAARDRLLEQEQPLQPRVFREPYSQIKE